MYNFIFIAGAPGTGKTTIMRLLQEDLHCPAIDFGNLRIFHLDRSWSNASTDEEAMAFENLVFILHNYAHHGYTNIIVTDLLEDRIQQIPTLFHDYRYIIVTLIVANDTELKRRVTHPMRDSGFRNVEAATTWNRHARERDLLPHEYRLDNTNPDPHAAAAHILDIISQSKTHHTSRQGPQG